MHTLPIRRQAGTLSIFADVVVAFRFMRRKRMVSNRFYLEIGVGCHTSPGTSGAMQV